MKVKATAKYIRMSPRKVRLVVDLVRGLPIEDAKKQLMFSRKAAAKPVLKVLNSAVANAENNFSLNTEDYIVAEAYVDQGPTIKRYRPRAHGRAALIRKRMSHITIVVGPANDTVENKHAISKEADSKKADVGKAESKEQKNTDSTIADQTNKKAKTANEKSKETKKSENKK
ncbi:50S ribosomal protein L22 [Candidatus Parcubacteria bacterium]|nr:MAG: 50S ribosomal protein L22 [Candidatus Parcubacteria bacterium]